MFAYGPADATAIPKPHHLLPHLSPDWFYLSITSLPRFPEIEAIRQFSGWLGSRVVSVLDSGAEGPGSNRSCDAVR